MFNNADKEEVKKEKFTVDWDVSAAEKGGYEHFMMKETKNSQKLSEIPSVRELRTAKSFLTIFLLQKKILRISIKFISSHAAVHTM